MSEHKHIVIVAGEESGDLLAASLISGLYKSSSQPINFSGIGGTRMQDAGAELIFNLAQYAVAGITEVLSHIKVIKKAFTLIKSHLEHTKPDLVILVDYPGFNLRLAKYIKKHLNLPVLYYVSPQIWAWKAGRIETIKKTVNHMAVIFPFEKAIYSSAGVPCSFVGNPLVARHNNMTQSQARAELNIADDTLLLTMMPGSRSKEIKRHMPVLIEAGIALHKKIPNLRILIPIAKSLSPALITKYIVANPTIFQITCMGSDYAMSACDAAIVSSGTASLECALYEKPMCIIYKCSFITYMAACFFIKIPYIGLPNVLLQQMAVPELLQYDCNKDSLVETATELLLKQSKLSQKIKSKLHTLKISLSSENADNSITNIVKNMLKIQ